MGKAAESCLLGDTQKSSLQLIFLSGWALIPLHLSRINAALSRFLPNPLPHPPQKDTVCFGKEQSSANPLKIHRAGLFRLTSSSISLQRQARRPQHHPASATDEATPCMAVSPAMQLSTCWGLQGPGDVPKRATTAGQCSRVGQPGDSGLFKLQWPEEGEQKQQQCSDTDRKKRGSYARAGGVLVCGGQAAESDSPGTPSQVPAALTTPKGAGERHHGHQQVHSPPQH